MDEASGLIAELQQKLEGLDHKIWLYRRDMTSEFTKYAETLLRDVPEDVSMTVSSAIAESMKNYPSLDPARQEAEAVCLPDSSKAAAESTPDDLPANPKALAIPIMPSRLDEAPTDQPRSPHEREREFAGVFTQSYLPLLDNRRERRSSSDTTSPSSGPSESPKSPPLPQKVEEKGENNLSSSYSGPPTLSLPKVPMPKRRNTDEQSIVSDHSDSGVPRRSALRRSSSSSKASPRRVRFEFAGKEFPTTSSPNVTTSSLSAAKGPPIILGMGDEDSDEETGVQLVEDIEDEPPPKKVSSSQALRALSRGPIEDDGTKWEEVKAPPDGSASVSIADAGDDDSDDEGFLSMSRSKKPNVNGTPGKKSPPPESGETNAGKLLSNKVEGAEDDITAAEDEETLAEMAPLEQMPTEKSIYAKTPQIPLSGTNSNYSSSSKGSRSPPPPQNDDYDDDDNDDDEEEMFEFEENMESSQEVSKPRKANFEDDASDSEGSPASPTKENIVQYSTSPARPIIRPSSPPANNRTPSGSLRNSFHPFQTPIVSEAMHAKAASLGEVNSFVGSVNGASGIDESDLKTFRTSGGVGSFSQGFPAGGNPMSLSQRLMLEEAMEEEKINGRGQ